ncbi:hypothetical protein VP01_1267g3 [Puccinia sorghi]|uniref:Uncharacterized protein n=1 Tax=Puccinia sorghi TaxID=27349 RepID=A0A0L6VPC3_9BASI|nr:hypothetical protein VP01_1267g3 [Puccinia sorghi]
MPGFTEKQAKLETAKLMSGRPGQDPSPFWERVHSLFCDMAFEYILVLHCDDQDFKPLKYRWQQEIEDQWAIIINHLSKYWSFYVLAEVRLASGKTHNEMVFFFFSFSQNEFTLCFRLIGISILTGICGQGTLQGPLWHTILLGFDENGQRKPGTAIQMIINILNFAANHSNSVPNIASIPKDPQTIILRANLDVKLTEKICCWECFQLFDLLPTTPWRCNDKHFKDSDPCHEELFIKKKLYKGHKDFGDLLYYSKPPNICPAIVGVPRYGNGRLDSNQSRLKDQGYYSDIQHGKVFKNTKWRTRTDILRLGVSLFFDWFNPRGNKISGIVESTGVLALSCLNLPPTVCNKLSHLCIAGITPGPYSPNPQTFNHILSPLVDELIQLDAGWCSHSNSPISTRFDSKKSTSESAQDDILKATGVRWSELNHLSYWDPIRHVVLGVMHNWLKGILQGHFCYQWKYGWVPPNEAKKKRLTGPKASGSSKQARITIESAMEVDEDTDEDYDSDDSDKNDEDILLNGGFGGSFFSEYDINQFQKLMKQVNLPPGVPQLPANLGEGKHGKLSASQWHTLSFFIVPIVLCEMYLDEVGHVSVSSNRYKFVANRAHLLAFKNVIFAQKFKEADIKRFELNYRNYSDSVGGLFEGVKVQPNHHFSLHIPQQMAAWGPLSGVTEFPGERLIGFLQKVNTNNKIDEMHQSMITRGWLQLLMADRDYSTLAQSQSNQPKLDKQAAHGTQTRRLNKLITRYMLLFNLVSSKDASVVHRQSFPVPRGHWMLSGEVLPLQSINCGGLVVGTMPLRNCVVAMVGGKLWYGLVRHCYSYKHHGGEVREFMVVLLITNWYPKLFLWLLDNNVFSIPENGIALIPCGYDAHLIITAWSFCTLIILLF